MELKLYSTITEIDPLCWNMMSGLDFPFSDHTFLSTLEKSAAVGNRSGWQPFYLTLWQDRVLSGAMLLYYKTNSYGEYIFDWDWARAYQAHGRDYYPKLVSAIPFTPATGHKILISPNAQYSKVAQQLFNAVYKLNSQLGCNSIHYLFIHPTELATFLDNGFTLRHSLQFHWRNRDYQDFNDFLNRLKSRKRKLIKNERLQVQRSGVHIVRLQGDELTDEHAVIMGEFYRNTIEKKAAIAYLNNNFFQMIFQNFKKNIVLFLASLDGRWVAGALNFQKGNKLFGRYWGCRREYRFLHFELCYYQAIEYAITNKLRMVEAGAQGEHKVQRGFLPELTYSAHYIKDRDFKAGVDQYIALEKRRVWSELELYYSSSPYIS
ncbi:MAG: GNAT family N-acetyltransferase [Magnetococcales bacterium]|nr:GNAT family N-acetyltransferase [Magnetococcales bacterium]